MLRLVLAFDVISPLLQHALRQHSQMSKERDATGDDCLDLGQNFAASFGLDGFGARGHETFAIGQCALNGLVALVWQVGDQ